MVRLDGCDHAQIALVHRDHDRDQLALLLLRDLYKVRLHGCDRDRIVWLPHSSSPIPASFAAVRFGLDNSNPDYVCAQ